MGRANCWGLKWSDVSFERDVITVMQTKTLRLKAIAINELSRERLIGYKPIARVISCSCGREVMLSARLLYMMPLKGRPQESNTSISMACVPSRSSYRRG